MQNWKLLNSTHKETKAVNTQENFIGSLKQNLELPPKTTELGIHFIISFF